MVRITLHVTYSRPSLTREVFAVVCLLVAGLALPAAPPTEAQPGPQATYLPHGVGRHFYLTQVFYQADEVLTACGPGYHMASLWEILDPSNLIYDYDNPAARTLADSGIGPPSCRYGWLHTGFDSSNSPVVGTGNCSAWTSAEAGDFGSVARLSCDWEGAPGLIRPWDAKSPTCNSFTAVWCVADITTAYLPLIMRKH